MLLKPGDKVSFLNEKRDGVVQKILNNKMVLVEIEDGFTIPVLEHDLVKIYSAAQSEERNIPAPKPAEEVVEETEGRFAKRIELSKSLTDQEKVNSGLFIAFVPEYPHNILSSGIGVYLVNHNEHDTLFIYSIKEQGQFVGRDFDKLDEESAILLDIIDATDIATWCEIQFQFLFFKQGVALNKLPFVYEMNIKPVRFYKEDNFVLHSLLKEKCFLLPLSDKDEKIPEDWSEEKWENRKIEKLAGVKVVGHINDYFKVEPVPAKHIIEKGVAEVDLHIQEIIESHSGLNSFEIMSMQMNYFTQMLEIAISNKFRKIIFIHGVGDGILKQEIINRLKTDYAYLKFQDAPLIKYGLGATEVLIGH